jgi:hypothetical protein
MYGLWSTSRGERETTYGARTFGQAATTRVDGPGRLEAMATPKRKKAPVKQHDPTPEERDERVSLHPMKPESVLRKLLRPAPRRRGGDPG